MKKSDVTCPNCNAGYRRIELTSRRGAQGEYRCLLCDEVLEVLDGSTDVALRLTVQPKRPSNSGRPSVPTPRASPRDRCPATNALGVHAGDADAARADFHGQFEIGTFKVRETLGAQG